MRISFDLDDTLFVNPEKFAVEKPLRFPMDRLYKERLRLGTVDLLDKLHESGIEVWIYTTSFRSERYICGLFRHYGIRLDGVINGNRHAAEIQNGKREPMPSKYPSKYKIDLHIDDDISVKQNGDTYGFRVMIVGAYDSDWAEKIIKAISKIQNGGKNERQKDTSI